MDTLIFSASPMKAFSSSLILILFLLGLGGMGMMTAIFRRRERMYARLGMGFASIILLLAGIGSAFASFSSFQNGDKTVTVLVDEKREVVSNCNDGNTCTSYLLETHAGQEYYDFTVGKSTWKKIEVNSCYRFTYYPPKSLLGEYLQERDYSETYESAAAITHIEQVPCP